MPERTRTIRVALLMAAAVAAFALLLGCGLKVVHRAVYDPDDRQDMQALQGLDGEAPWLKAHLPDGRLCILSQWHINEATNEISGDGVLYDACRDTLDAGGFTVAIDSVAIFESNVLQTSTAIASLTVITVASVAMSGYCLTNPKACFGSCPTFYAPGPDGTPLLQAEGFSASVAPSLEAHDVDALFRQATVGKRFTLTMTNEALETHVVRHADLLVVPRPPDGRVLQTADGRYVEVANLRPPVRCFGDEGDITEWVAANDGRERCSPADSTDLATREVLELDFTGAPDGPVGLVVASRHALLSTYLFYQGLAYLGENAAPALLAAGNPEFAGAQSLGELLGRIEVQLPAEDGQWRTIGSVGETGPLAGNVHLLSLPGFSAADPRVRLRLTRGHWRLDWLALASVGREVQPLRIAPNRVSNHGQDDPGALANLLQAENQLVTFPGDRYELVYDLPDPAQELEIFLESRGYYLEWMRTEWLAEQDMAHAAMLLRKPELALRYLAPAYKQLEPDLETEFWGSRYGVQPGR